MLQSMMSHKHSCSAALFKYSDCRVADTAMSCLLSALARDVLNEASEAVRLRSF